MKCALVTKFGKANEVVVVASDYARPALVRGSGQVLVRVQACSFTPGDIRMSSGSCDLIKKPDAFPYIPGLDVCGIVEEVEEGETKFKVGDRVAGTWGDTFGVGGTAEYAALDDPEYDQANDANRNHSHVVTFEVFPRVDVEIDLIDMENFRSETYSGQV